MQKCGKIFRETAIKYAIVNLQESSCSPPPSPPPPRLLASIFHSGWEESRKSFYIVKFIGFCFRPSPTPPGSFLHPQILLIKNKLYQKPSEYRFMLTIHYNMQICLISAVQNSTLQFTVVAPEYSMHTDVYKLQTPKQILFVYSQRKYYSPPLKKDKSRRKCKGRRCCLGDIHSLPR